jgi:DNA-binding MarR family transcriptional regulator
MTEAAPPTDHVARLIALRRRETPEIPLDGMEILSRARRLDQLSRFSIEAVFEKHGLDTGEFDVLASLQRVGAPYALRPTELYRSLMITSGGLTDRLNRLTQKGLVRRLADPSDRRSLRVELTPLGLTTIRAAFEEDMRVESDLLAMLGPDERKTLAALLARVLVVLERRWDDPPPRSLQHPA